MSSWNTSYVLLAVRNRQKVCSQQLLKRDIHRILGWLKGSLDQALSRMISLTDYLISLTCFSVNSSFEISEKLRVGLPSSRTTNRTEKKTARPHLKRLFSVKKKKKNTAFKISCRSNNDRRQNNYQIERLNDALFVTPITMAWIWESLFNYSLFTWFIDTSR